MVGDIIRSLRKDRNLTQFDLANMIGYDSSSAIAMVERGERNHSIDILIKLSKIFNVSVDHLLGLDKNDKTLINKIEKLSQSDKEKALKIIDIFLNK